MLTVVSAAVLSAQTLAPEGSSIGSTNASANRSASTTAAGPAVLAATPEDFARLKLAPGFLLDIQVYDAPELSGSYRVDEGGAIHFPLIGAVHVGGSNLSEARAEILSRLKDGKVLNYPDVTINVQQYAPFNITVLGEVNNPGRLQLLAPHSLADVIAMAGGETSLAGSTIELRRADAKTSAEQSLTYTYMRSSGDGTAKSAVVEPGDTVIVKRAGVVYVLGAVNRPGGYVMQEDGRLDIAEALSLAGGTATTARTGGLRVVRRKQNGAIEDIPVSYTGLTNGRTPPMTLQAEDIVYVPVSKLKAMATSGTSIIGSAASATIYTLR